MACGVEPLVGVVEREGNVDRGAPDQQPVRVDETARGKRTVIGLQAALDDAGQERRSVERSGGRANDKIEAVEQSPALQRARQARGAAPTHPASPQPEREPLTVRARSGSCAKRRALAQKRQHGVWL